MHNFSIVNAIKPMHFAFLREIFNCKYDLHKEYLDNLKYYRNYINSDYPLKYGENGDILLTNGKFLSYMCKKAKFHVIKMVSVYLEDLMQFIEDPELEIFIIHLIRDPRAIVDSARRITNTSEISTANYYCDKIRSDLKTSEMLKRKYPNR